MRFITTLFNLLIVAGLGFNQIDCKYINETTNLSSLTNDQIHEFAIRDQVAGDSGVKPFKSLKTRPTLSLDGLWDFCFDNFNEGFRQKWQNQLLKSSCSKGNFYRMPVPSAFNDITSNKTAKNYVGWFWYQRVVSSEEINLNRYKTDVKDLAKRIFVQFESVNYMAIVWIAPQDGKNKSHLLGTHVGGYLPFAFNLTDAILTQYNVETKSSYLLTVAVSNRLTGDTIPSGSMKNLSDVVGYPYEKFQPDFDFFHFAGLLGQVNLIELSHVHIQDLIMTGRSFDHDTQVASFRLIPMLHIMPNNFRYLVRITISSSGSNGTQSMSVDQDVYKHRISNYNPFHYENFMFLLEKSDWWQAVIGDPNHFASFFVQVKVSLFGASPGLTETPLDVFETRLGFNTLHLDHKANILRDLTNRQNDNKNYRLRGFGMHQEQLFSGRTMSLPAIMKDMYLLKQVGANVIRTSHYPYSSEYLDACDENGISVIAECQAVGLNSFSELKLKLHKQLLKEMVERDHLHPSIIMWSIANEPQSQMPEARNYFDSLIKYAKTELADYTTKADRPITAAIAQSHEADTIGDLLDVIMVNRYYGWYDYSGVIESIRPSLSRSLLGWATKHPAKPLILSEFGADTLAGLHQTTSGLFSEEYQSKLLVEYEQTLDELAGKSIKGCHAYEDTKINLWGSMIWNFADFSTHDSLSRVGGNKKGIFTQSREPKLAAIKVVSGLGVEKSATI